MNKEVQSYLKSYSFDPDKVNRLIVSNFLNCNNLEKVQNRRILELSITQDSDDHNELLRFIEIHEIKNVEDLIEVFEFVVSPEAKVVTGAIYTPEPIRDFILAQTLKDLDKLSSIKICDPACGCASFLYSASFKIHEQTGRAFSEIYRDNIFGLDIQGYSVERSKILLALAAILNGDDQKNTPSTYSTAML